MPNFCPSCSFFYFQPQFNDAYDSNQEASLEKRKKLMYIVFMVIGVALMLSALLMLIFLSGNIGATLGAFTAFFGGVVFIALGSCCMIKASIIKEANIRLTAMIAQKQSDI